MAVTLAALSAASSGGATAELNVIREIGKK